MGLSYFQSTVPFIFQPKDQQIKTYFTQVTVDNIPPELESSYPASGDKITPINGQITLLTQVIDNLGIQNVIYYMDGKQVATLNNYPYSYPWVATPGEHQLKIILTDLAGNTIKEDIRFSVR